MKLPTDGEYHLYDTDIREKGRKSGEGYIKSERPKIIQAVVKLNTCGAGFYKPQPVVEFLCEFQNSKNTLTRLDEKQRKKFAKEITGIKIETTHVKRKPRKCAGLSRKSAREEVFEHEGEEVSVANYFREKYKKQLEYPDLPCVKIGQKGSLIPMELCRVTEGQKKQSKLTRQQTKEMIRHTAIPAPDYMQKIMQLIQKLRYESDPYSRDFGISIGKEMVTIQGRVLEPLILIYGPRNRPGKETPQDGSWKNTKPMLDAKKLREWALISYRHNDDRRRSGKYRGPDYLDDPGMDDFIYYLVDVGRKKRVRVNENPCYVGLERGFQGTDKLFNNLKTRYPNLQLIVVILPVNGDDFYEEVKHCGDVVYGITTQCIKVEHASSDFTVWGNQEILARLWLQINAKLGGTTCVLYKDVKSPILQRPVVIFGMIFNIDCFLLSNTLLPS